MSEPNVPPPPGAGASNKTLMLVLAYLFPLSLIPLLTDKEDAEVQWHAKHGIVLGVFFWALCILTFIITQIPFVGCLTVFLFPIIGLGAFIVTILAIIKATQGQRFIIPGVSNFVEKF
ncbi:MAG: DUF4870 domain-containing protein [Thermoanaerobaculia bacterium]